LREQGRKEDLLLTKRQLMLKSWDGHLLGIGNWIRAINSDRVGQGMKRGAGSNGGYHQKDYDTLHWGMRKKERVRERIKSGPNKQKRRECLIFI